MVKGLTYVWRYSFFILIGKQTVNALSWRFKFSSPQVTTVPEIIFSLKKGCQRGKIPGKPEKS